MNLTQKFAVAAMLTAISMAGCTPAPAITTKIIPQPEPTIITLPSPVEMTAPAEGTATEQTTQNNLTGNRIADGNIDLQHAATLDIHLEGKPIWLVSAVWDESVFFVTVTDHGKTQAFKILGNAYEPIATTPTQLPAGMPPTLIVNANGIELLAPPEDASPLTNPLQIGDRLAYIATNGDLVFDDSTSQTRLPINALPDARIVVDENNRLLVLTQPSTRYDHGILGDTLEASAITLIETQPEPRVVQTISIDAPDVIEGLAPIWADLDNDGRRDIIVTLSNNLSGSRIAAFHEDGTLLASTAPIGLGHRWRQQIAVAQFGPSQPPTLVSIRTPHIGGSVEFFQLRDSKLENVGDINGFSSHSIGSRNLDSALVGDFNNDDIHELLAPDQSHTNLGIVGINGVVAMLPLGGTLTSNISATSLNGKMFVGAGTQGNLRVWIP